MQLRLGEFEQGRPLIESIRKDYPEYKILLTFFSPFGFEVEKIMRGMRSQFLLLAFGYIRHCERSFPSRGVTTSGMAIL